MLQFLKSLRLTHMAGGTDPAVARRHFQSHPELPEGAFPRGREDTRLG